MLEQTEVISTAFSFKNIARKMVFGGSNKQQQEKKKPSIGFMVKILKYNAILFIRTTLQAEIAARDNNVL